MAREVRLWEWLRDGVRRLGTGIHVRRVENRVGEGDPDVDGCWAGRYFEVELKGCDRPARGGRLDFEVRSSQVVWHRRRRRALGNIWVLVRVGQGPGTSRYLVTADHTPELRAGVTEARLAELAVLPPTADAVEVLRRMADGQGA